jgi:hypothetical protein
MSGGSIVASKGGGEGRQRQRMLTRCALAVLSLFPSRLFQAWVSPLLPRPPTPTSPIWMLSSLPPLDPANVPIPSTSHPRRIWSILRPLRRQTRQRRDRSHPPCLPMIPKTSHPSSSPSTTLTPPPLPLPPPHPLLSRPRRSPSTLRRSLLPLPRRLSPQLPRATPSTSIQPSPPNITPPSSLPPKPPNLPDRRPSSIVQINTFPSLTKRLPPRSLSIRR